MGNEDFIMSSHPHPDSADAEFSLLISCSPYAQLLDNISPPNSLRSSPDCPSLGSTPSFSCDDMNFPGDDIDLSHMFMSSTNPGPCFERYHPSPSPAQFGCLNGERFSQVNSDTWFELSDTTTQLHSLERSARTSTTSSIYDPIPVDGFEYPLPDSSYGFPEVCGTSIYGSFRSLYPSNITSTPLSRSSTHQSPRTRAADLGAPESSSSAASLHNYGIQIQSTSKSTSQLWRCAYPGCTSRIFFTRGCDLRKHFKRHSKRFFCRVRDCPQSEAVVMATALADRSDPSRRSGNPLETVAGCFSSKKDRSRHEAKHNPEIRCDWKGTDGEQCKRLFSRVDNMKDHVRRIHREEK